MIMRQTILHVSLLRHRPTPGLHVCQTPCAICVEFHRPQAVCYENCLSTFKRVFPTEIDVESMFTCQTVSHLWFCVFHLCERILKFMIGCKTASLRTVFPRTVIPHTSVFHENDDASVSVIKCPTDQKSGNLSSLILLRTRTRSPNPTTLFGAFVSCVCFMWRDFYCSTVTQVHIICTKKFWISTPHRLASSTIICKRSLSARTRCSARPFARLCSTSVTPVGSPSLPAVLCTTSRRHSS